MPKQYIEPIPPLLLLHIELSTVLYRIICVKILFVAYHI